jgi:hypothetical protein
MHLHNHTPEFWAEEVAAAAAFLAFCACLVALCWGLA